MFIANPIFDVTFKYLMEDLEIARKLISAIINEDIIELEVRPQEHTTTSQSHFLTVYRMDFKALIKTKDETLKKVIIELQKSKKAFDVLRFRHYLGDNYSQTDMVDGLKVSLPIIPIYILGFKLSIDKPLLKIGRVYQDISTGQEIVGKDDFIEQLSHDCFIIQIPLLSERVQSKVERLLSVFNQQWVLDHNEEWLMRYPKEEEIKNYDPDLIKMLKRLEAAAESTGFKERIRAERELDDFIADKLREGEVALAQKEIELKLTKKDREELRKEKDEIKKEKDEIKKETEEIKKQTEKIKKETEEIKKQIELERLAKENALEELERLRKLLDKK